MNDAQTVTKSYDYDAFGNEKEPSTTDANPFRYCSEYFDKETGTYYLRARYYDPSIGRFTQQDTHWNTANMIYGDNPQKINQSQDALGLGYYSYSPNLAAIIQAGNLYVYCGSNPIKYLDQTGNFFNTVTGAVFGGIFGAINAASNGYSWKSDEFWTYVLIGSAAGALSGAVVDLAIASGGVLAFAGATIAGGFINLSADGAIADLEGRELSSDEMVLSFMVGSLSNAASFALAGKGFAKRGGSRIQNLFDDTTKTIYSDTVVRVPISGTTGKIKALQEVADIVVPTGKGVAIYVDDLQKIVSKNILNEFGTAMLMSTGTYIYTKSVSRY